MSETATKPLHVAPDNERVNRELLERVRGGEAVIPLRARLGLTKTVPALSEAILLRDLDLERETRHWIGERSSYEELIERYLAYDRDMASIRWPQHIPIRTVCGTGPVCSGSNIFTFFPAALGLEADREEDIFGFEFIDIWLNGMHEAVFPCANVAFTSHSHLACMVALHGALEKTIYLSSAFHEIGHRVGPLRVSPQPRPELKLDGFRLDTVGELSTDSLLCTRLTEFPEVALFVFLQRTFWFTRRAFRDQPEAAMINEDNDSWAGAYLWRLAEEKGVVVAAGDAFDLNVERLPELFGSVLEEIDALGTEVLAQDTKEAQEALVDAWMNRGLERGEGGRFVLPASLARVFQECQHVPERPHFAPPVAIDAEIKRRWFGLEEKEQEASGRAPWPVTYVLQSA